MLDGLEIYETLYWLLYVATCVNRHIQASLVKHGLHSSVLLCSRATERWKRTHLPASILQRLLSSVGLDPAEGHAEHLDTLLKRGVAQREAAIQAADELLKSVLGRACQRVEVFGSCKYGPALPSADIDIVGVVNPQALGASSSTSLKARVQDRLRVLADEARASPGFSRVCLAAPKSTVCLRYADHSLDVTMGTEDHRPMKLSNQVKTLLDKAERTRFPPCGIRRLLRVVLVLGYTARVLPPWRGRDHEAEVHTLGHLGLGLSMPSLVRAGALGGAERAFALFIFRARPAIPDGVAICAEGHRHVRGLPLLRGALGCLGWPSGCDS